MILSFRIERKWLLPTYTIGCLSYKVDNNEWVTFCDTLEDRVRDYNKDGKLDEPKVYGETAIPFGHYKFIIAYSPTLKKECPVLLDVPGFTGAMIHNGANSSHTKGCPLVGENKVKGGLINSVATFERLMELINSNVQSEYDLIIV